MYIPCSILLLSSLISLALTARPPRPNTDAQCYNWAGPPPTADDCTHLLERLSTVPWAQQQTVYGRNLASPGQLPLGVTYRSCRLVLDTNVYMSEETMTLRLVEEFPRVYQIISRCFMQEVTYNEGVVDVTEGRRFHVTLSGIFRLNETTSGESVKGVGTPNAITFG